MHLKFSKTEIEKAENSLKSMQESDSIKEVEKHWRDFLNHIEKIWNKSERECQTFKNVFQPWQGKFVRLRKKDPLLKYMKNARDADVHTINEIVKENGPLNFRTGTNTESGFIEKDNFKEGEPVEVSFSMNIKGINLKAGSESPEGFIEKYVFQKGEPVKIKFGIELEDTKLDASEIENNNNLYSTPISHLGKALDNPKNPFEIGKLGLEFYKMYIEQIESKFF